jgi:hypothetical protein
MSQLVYDPTGYGKFLFKYYSSYFVFVPVSFTQGHR